MKMKMKNKNCPQRRCIGCMESKDKNTLIRIAWSEEKLSVDPTGKANGRGVYLCKNHDCMEKARKRNSIARSLKIELTPEESDRIFEELKAYEE